MSYTKQSIILRTTFQVICLGNDGPEPGRGNLSSLLSVSPLSLALAFLKDLERITFLKNYLWFR